MLKNKAGQKWRVFAFNRNTNLPVLGDAANITAQLSKDWGAAAATNDVNPTESLSGGGYYLFDMQQAETNADGLDLFPVSATGDVQVIDARSFSISNPINVWTYIDSVNGTAGGDGTISNPVDTFATATALPGPPGRFRYFPSTDAFQFNSVAGATIPAGQPFWIIDLQGTTIGDSNTITWPTDVRIFSSNIQAHIFVVTSFTYANVSEFWNIHFLSSSGRTISLTGSANFTDCVFGADALLTLNFLTTVASISTFRNCVFGKSVLTAIKFPGSGLNLIKCMDCQGDVELKGMTTDNVFVFYGTGKLIIEGTSTGGEITVSKGVEVFESDGTTPWDYTNTTGRPTIELVSNINSQTSDLVPYFQLGYRSDTSIETDKAAQLAILNADEGTGPGDYASTSDSQEAIRAVAGGGGGGGGGYTPFG